MATDNRQADFISEARVHARAIYDAVNALVGMQNEFNYGGYGSGGADPLPAGSGANAGILAADVGAVVFDTADALKTVLDGGHGANLAKLL
jgi:hypothetical protein